MQAKNTRIFIKFNKQGKIPFLFFLFAFLSALFFSSCSAPRTVLNSGKVTPHKTLRAGFDYSISIATQPIKSILGNTKDLAETLSSKDSIVFDEVIPALNTAILAYALDPINTGYNFYGRYGLFKKVDIGYKYSGPHVFDARYQFMGSSGTFDEPGEKGAYGSIGIQYSSQKYELPDVKGLDKLQDILGLDFKRKDILIPLIFSNSFGTEEKYGAVSYGLAYAHTFVRYSMNPKNIYWVAGAAGANIDKELIPSVSVRTNYPSFGTFLNIKLGYKYVYGLASFAMYYQKYGTYPLLGGESAKFKGFSFIPSAGIFFDLPFKKIFKKKTSGSK